MAGYGDEQAASVSDVFKSEGSAPVTITLAPCGSKSGTQHGLWWQTDLDWDLGPFTYWP